MTKGNPWQSLRTTLVRQDCEAFGAGAKETVIYELELAAAVLGLSFWAACLAGNLVTWFGDNDSVRFALVRASATGCWAEALMRFHLTAEVEHNMKAWLARVPTEANLSDFPSRLCEHPLLKKESECSEQARASFETLKTLFVTELVSSCELEGGGVSRIHPRAEKRSGAFS